MADINLKYDLEEQDAVALVELLFFAYRDFVADPDHVLEDLGFGRAHHRVLHFVGRDPGMTVASLLEILQITKQSLARVLKELIDSIDQIKLLIEESKSVSLGSRSLLHQNIAS